MNDQQIAISVKITKFVDIGYPGFVECVLVDANGLEWTFVDKIPIVACKYLDENSSYPQDGQIACEVISRRVDENGRSVVLVDTDQPWHINSVTGQTRFEVFDEQLVTPTWEA
jgi:hypothetical protein